MTEAYWIIEYKIKLLSDFHVGAGIRLLGGNLHGLRLDQDGWPYLPHTQVRGLLRWGGINLKKWHPKFGTLFSRNFGQAGRKLAGIYWSYSRAALPSDLLAALETPEEAGWFTEQSHVALQEGIVDHLFSYQKTGPVGPEFVLHGKIYSVEPATAADVAFLIAAMRADDRIGHRRSRGYGKVTWELTKVSCYPAICGDSPASKDKKVEAVPDSRKPGEWLDLVCAEVQK